MFVPNSHFPSFRNLVNSKDLLRLDYLKPNTIKGGSPFCCSLLWDWVGDHTTSCLLLFSY